MSVGCIAACVKHGATYYMRGRCRHYILTCRRHHPTPPPEPQTPADRDSRSITSAFHVQLSRRWGGLAGSAAAPRPFSPPRHNPRPFGSTAASTTSRGRTADDVRPRVIIFRHFALIAPPTTTHPLPNPTRRFDPATPHPLRVLCTKRIYAARNIVYHNAGAQNTARHILFFRL